MKGHILFVFGAQSCVPEDALSAAKEMGFRVSVIAPHVPCGGAAALADRIESGAAARPDVAVRTAAAIDQGNRINGVMAYDDQSVPVVARIAEALELPGHPVAAAEAARDKFLMKQRFAAAGIPIASYTLAENEEAAVEWAAGARYPVVVKPVRGSASQGVIRADDEEELRNAYRRVRRIVRDFGLETGNRSDAEQLVEKYLPGSEFSVELLVQGGASHVLCVFEKPVPLEGPFFEETIYVTPPTVEARVRRQLEELAVRAALALGLRDGAAHCELRVSADDAFVLEVGARLIGGACSRVFEHALGESIHPSLLRVAMGQYVEPPKQRDTAAGAMMLPIVGEGKLRSVRGVERARLVPGVRDAFVTAAPGDVILPFPEQSCYVGFVTAVEATPSKTAAALSEAARAIEFELTPLACERWSREIRGFTAPDGAGRFGIKTIEHLSSQQAREGVTSVIAAAQLGYLPAATALAKACECVEQLDGAHIAQTERSFWLLAGERNGVAFCSVSESTGYISCLAVVPGKQASGLEAALANACMERLANEGAVNVDVDLDLRQPGMTSLYRQLGFNPKTQDCGCGSC